MDRQEPEDTAGCNGAVKQSPGSYRSLPGKNRQIGFGGANMVVLLYCVTFA